MSRLYYSFVLEIYIFNQKNIMKNSVVYVLLFLILLFSCEKSDIERSLTLAGDNAIELKKVLDHYSKNVKDSLKYKAAVFLIENMPGHCSFGGKSVDNFYKAVDSVLLVEKNKEVLKQKIDSLAKVIIFRKVQNDLRM